MVDRKTRDRLIEKLENIFDLSNKETVNFLDKLFDMVWSELMFSTLRMADKKNRLTHILRFISTNTRLRILDLDCPRLRPSIP